MKCKLCINGNDFGKSHVIPESFFLHNKIEDEMLLIASNRDGFYPKRRPIGEYDKNILCKSCEKTFSEWDDYGKTLLLDKFEEFKTIQEGNNVLGYQLDSYNYQKLKLGLDHRFGQEMPARMRMRADTQVRSLRLISIFT